MQNAASGSVLRASELSRSGFGKVSSNVRKLTRRIPALILAALIPSAAAALDSEECLGCHEDPDMTGEREGVEISVFIDPGAFASSIHGDLACDDCHADLVGLDDMHEDDVESVDCGNCHDGEVEEIDASRHGRLGASDSRWAPGCSDCHGSHEIRPVDERARPRRAVMTSPRSAPTATAVTTSCRRPAHGR